ncbi:agamous-like MADS-box protein AGL17 isoform X2 [Solanum dulcamara]|nr:agamous-like MADS-box protein AGL17 isoform X2 [Solanum dulcamara]
MGRSKIKVELIQDHKKRMTTLVKRKAGLVKKISQLSILCNIKACMIIYEGNNHQHDQIWPNDPNEVKELINLYKNQPFQGRSKRDKTLSNYFEDDQKKKVDIVPKKYPTWDSRFDYLSEKELQNLVGLLEKKMENAKGKVEFLKNKKIQDSNIASSLSHQEIWDFPELLNDNNLTNQTTLWPISYVNPFTDYNNFFQANIPIIGVNSMAEGMDNGLLTIEDYQFCNANYSTMIEAENWLANDESGSSLTMQPMGNNDGVGSTSTMQPMNQYPFIYNDSTHDMPYGFL